MHMGLEQLSMSNNATLWQPLALVATTCIGCHKAKETCSSMSLGNMPVAMLLAGLSVPKQLASNSRDTGASLMLDLGM